MTRLTRRGVLAGSAAVGGLSLAGCGNGPDQYSNSGGPEQGPRVSEPGQGGPGPVGTTNQVPVGGGKVYANRRIVVTQPTAGNFKAFDAICTHQGCLVSKVTNGVIMCPCHGSTYSVVDGSVRTGPATQPLKPAAITVEGTQIRLID
jgi:Rieske Fe-S protein